jgi:nucleotide-binding universal stress UspA family protein
MRVLLATDGSRHSRRATRWLRDVGLPADTTITVLTVATLETPPPDGQTVRDLWVTVRRDARRVAERAAKTLGRRWPQVEVLVRDGDSRVEIVDVADEMRVGMIVLGARGLGRVRRVLIGSTSLSVARYAPCPVAIIRARPHKTSRLLAAVDGSDGSRHAIRFLANSELERESAVTLLHVVPDDAIREGGSPASPSDDRKVDGAERHDVEAENILRGAAVMLDQHGRRSEGVVAHGEPAAEIVKIAADRDVDLVVVGARGLRTLGRLLLGSVSETVLHRAGRPVLIVRE